MREKFRTWNREKVIGIFLLAFALIGPLVIHQNYIIHLMVMCAIYAGLACSMNIILGYTGLFSLAHAAFWGIGAYTSGILVGKLGFPIWVGFLLSGVVACIFGMIIAIPSLNLRGDYLAIVTLGFGQIVRLIELNEQWLTNGAMGITAIPKPALFGIKFGRVQFFYLALAITLLVMLVIYRLVKSRVGRALIAIRGDDLAAMAIGVNVRNYKILAFGIGTFCAGLMGSVYAHYITFISPDQYTFQISVNIFCMVILGGMGTTIGPVLGAIVLTLLPEVMRTFDVYRMIIVGLLMVLCMIFRPQGIIGSYVVGGTSIWDTLSRKRKKTKKGQQGGR